jgi:SAM-dependent methyltransferase
LNVIRYFPLYVHDAALRRQWHLEDELERAVRAGQTPSLTLGKRTRDTSERVVEIPWALSRVLVTPGLRVLDVGSAFAPHSYRRLLALAARHVDLHVVDLLPTHIPGATSHQADARSLPFPTGSFDAVVCISTLEHIGMDNADYGLPLAPSISSPADVVALRELARVARPHPGLIVTVPGGQSADFGWSRQYSPERWRDVIAEAGLQAEEITYFAHAPDGWNICGPHALGDRTYGDGARAAAGVICSRLIASET